MQSRTKEIRLVRGSEKVCSRILATLIALLSFTGVVLFNKITHVV